MPNGASAPGNVSPAPPPCPKSGPPGFVPTNGLTYCAGSVIADGAGWSGCWGCASAGPPGTPYPTAATTAATVHAAPHIRRRPTVFRIFATLPPPDARPQPEQPAHCEVIRARSATATRVSSRELVGIYPLVRAPRCEHLRVR